MGELPRFFLLALSPQDRMGNIAHWGLPTTDRRSLAVLSLLDRTTPGKRRGRRRAAKKEIQEQAHGIRDSADLPP